MGSLASARTAEMQVNRFDQVAGMLVAVLILLGTATALLFVVWLSSRLMFKPPALEVVMVEDVGGGGSGDNFTGGEQQLDEPAPEEFQQTTEPQLTETLESISTIVASEDVQLDVLESNTSQGRGEGSGIGDGRGIGPGGPGTSDGIPAWERWEVRLTATSLSLYAQQLDFFEVELGVAGGGSPNVEYVSQLSTPSPVRRVGNPKEEKRLRFLHRNGQLRDADRQLVTRAGVNPAGKVVFQFYSQATYQKLLVLENQNLKGRRIKDVLKTVFTVRGTPGKFEFVVVEQLYRNGG